MASSTVDPSESRSAESSFSSRAERIERYLRLFSLWDRRDEPAGGFSKGMKQKLAIARALLHEPSVVFLDEPTAALDPEAAYIVREAIEAIRRSGRTIVLATHNLYEADRLCDRVAFVRGGLLRVDSPADLRDSLGGRGVEVAFSTAPGEAEIGAARQVGGVTAAELTDHRLVVTAAEPRAITPNLVRALVAAGADVIDVRERATSLEQIYFEVMGVRPDSEDVA
jgi:ABC-2 type transport system ATP-binding protein